ncbi:hypothetical protein ABZ667_40785, partial [Streptomyces lavendulae]|uniref:hypothetical protein n=1 Tax=Streptomyces lavendulae TaxID=1914 RepID=UPI0033DC7355
GEYLAATGDTHQATSGADHWPPAGSTTRPLTGVGEYSVFGEDQQDQALAKFTQRVETLRNDQRRRQQQLDQPAEHAPVQGSSGA